MLLALAASRVAADTPPLTPDVPAKLVEARDAADFERREVMLPMRDGVKLFTVILVPKGARRAPIILTRTPYNAGKRAERAKSDKLGATLPVGDGEYEAGAQYIRVFQDVRGKYGSEGDYVMTRPLRGPLNDSTVDHATDAYDTIDWLVKNVKETNGNVGMIGSSYEGFTVLMALFHPHPALKAAVPMSPMVDGWRGDDWFHNGAFRQTNFDYFYGQTTAKGEGKKLARAGFDDFENFRKAGSAGAYATLHGFDQLPAWKKISEHPAYDAYWQGQALDALLAKEPLTVPTMVVGSLWDQEDIYGAVHVYAALESKDRANDKVSIVLGPWRHSGVNAEGSTLGPLRFGRDTAAEFRRDVMKPFLDAHLLDRGASPERDKAPRAVTPPAFVFQSSANRWEKLPAWPPKTTPKKLFLGEAGVAAWTETKGFDEYVADPQKPVAYVPRPVQFDSRDVWTKWLVMDQRAVSDRPDVLSYMTAPLTAPLTISGPPQVDLAAATTGTDADWVVKLIDVYPDEEPAQPELGGYQLPIAMDIFRGRYRDSLEKPTAIPAGVVQHYKFALPHANHVFQPGHRIMVQVQSSWFPLYDRNPQTFVANPFYAKPADYVRATQRVMHASSVTLPVR